MFSVVYDHLKLKIVVFSLAQNEPFISTMNVLLEYNTSMIYIQSHVATPCFY